jgi:hypothetical protein
MKLGKGDRVAEISDVEEIGCEYVCRCRYMLKRLFHVYLLKLTNRHNIRKRGMKT